ncbi:MAG: hybrid sensor histidine kinase/response regulator [Thiobacillaceae bacterium]|nr:hybrid sensor histidine kinase/response regulator [Thiobacillaceae bacterium]
MSRFRPTLGLRLRILAVAMLPLMMGVSLFAAYFTHRLVSEAERELETLGIEAAHHLGEAAAFDLSSGNLPNVKRLLDFDRAAREIPVIAITDGQRWLLISGNTLALPDLNGEPPPERWRLGAMHYFTHAVHPGLAGEASAGLNNKMDGTGLWVLVGLDRGRVELTRSQIGLAAAGMAALSVLLALVLAWRLAGGVSRPLQAITATVARLANGHLTERTPESSPGEIGLLESGVNRMAQALEENRRDLERRVQDATAELRGQKLAAESAVKAKSRFLAAASHDLRQPLHALSLLVAALKDRVRDKESRRLAEHIEASASAMEGLLNALLDLSRLDAGVVEAHPVCFPVARVFERVENQFALLARERGLGLSAQPTSLWAYTDPVLMERILANLVANALRYTEHGRVLIGARRVGDKLIRVEVRDTGKGIPEEFQERIFEEYFQLENPERHRDKGLGLGLAIVSRLANLLGGHVSVRSHPGRGSCFHLQVARCSAAAQRMAASLPASPGFALPLEHALVAVIDDDEAILEAMAEVFDHWGVGLAAGVDAEQVRDELVALGRAPDIILCDYRLRSGHTGIEAVHLLRQAFGADIAAALLTGDTAPDTIQAIDASGLPVLHKPLKPAKLRAFLSHLLATPPGQPAHKSFEQ